jgi:hypothetical protein
MTFFFWSQSDFGMWISDCGIIENQPFIIPQSPIAESEIPLSQSDFGRWISDCGIIENQRFIIPQSQIAESEIPLSQSSRRVFVIP